MAEEAPKKIFIVVEVQAGVAVGAQCFSSRASAEQRADEARLHFDENDDDVQVFQTTTDAAT